MEEERISLGTKEQKRATVLNQVLAGSLKLDEGAAVLGLSVRQLKRLKSRYRHRGPAALLHGNRGRAPWQAVRLEQQARILALAQDRYRGFNHQHLTEMLQEHEQLPFHRTTVRRILLAAGLRTPRVRRPPHHRSRRDRMAREGVLLQADGSRHRWLGAKGPFWTLVGAIDDATGTVPAAEFREQEDAQGYLRVLHQVVRTKGIPLGIYVDHHGIFQRHGNGRPSLEAELRASPVLTQVGRALQELGIQLIFAQSPQAKGRVERLWGTLQDRLVSELRLAQVHSLAEANQVLAHYLKRFNRQFAVPAADPTTAYEPVPIGLKLDRIFCFKYERLVQADNTVRFDGREIQLLPLPQRRSWVRARVEVHEHFDGAIAVYYRSTRIPSRAAPATATTIRARQGPRLGAGLPQAPAPPAPPRSAPPPPQPARLPSPTHPWRMAYQNWLPKTGTKSEHG
jgi:transposase